MSVEHGHLVLETGPSSSSKILMFFSVRVSVPGSSAHWNCVFTVCITYTLKTPWSHVDKWTWNIKQITPEPLRAPFGSPCIFPVCGLALWLDSACTLSMGLPTRWFSRVNNFCGTRDMDLFVVFQDSSSLTWQKDRHIWADLKIGELSSCWRDRLLWVGLGAPTSKKERSLNDFTFGLYWLQFLEVLNWVWQI